MFSLRHPNCVQLMGTCLAPPCLVTEYCQRGSLADCLREARRHRDAADCLTWHRRLLMVRGAGAAAAPPRRCPYSRAAGLLACWRGLREPGGRRLQSRVPNP